VLTLRERDILLAGGLLSQTASQASKNPSPPSGERVG